MEKPKLDPVIDCVLKDEKTTVLRNCDTFFDVRDLMIRNLRYVISKYKEYDSKMKEYVKSIEYRLGILESDMAELEDSDNKIKKLAHRLSCSRARARRAEEELHRLRILTKEIPQDIQNYTIAVGLFKEKNSKLTERVKKLEEDKLKLKDRIKELQNTINYLIRQNEKTNNVVCSDSAN